MLAQGTLSLIAPNEEGDDEPYRTTVGAVMAVTLVVAACSSGTSEETPRSITLMAHDSFAASVTSDTFASFTRETELR